jgi:hypothetical protein
MSDYVSNKKTKFGRYVDTDWHNMWQKDNLESTTVGLLGGLGSAVGTALTTSQIKDTANIESGIDSVGNTQFSTGSFDNLLAQFDVNNMADTNLTQQDLMLYTPGQQVANVLLAGANGFLGTSFGNQFAGGGLVSRGINTGLNMLGAGIGAIVANKKAKEEAARLNILAEEANKRYLNNFNNAVSNTRNTMFNNSLLNISSYGGPLFNHSENFSNGVTFINEGGTHEQNPLGGVPVGVDQEGTPNLVEEGEVIWNDYVFSNRLKPTKRQLEKAGYGDKYQGLTFARIAEKLQEGSSERPNDAISNNSLNDSLSGLMVMQEEIRMKRRNKENIFSNGGKVNILSGEEELYNKLINSLASQGKHTDIDGVLEYVGNKMAVDSRMGINSNLEGLYNFILGRKQLLTPETDAEIQSQIDAETALLEPTYKKMGLDGSIAAHRARLNGSSSAGIKTGDDKIVEDNKSFLSNLRYTSPLIHGVNLINNLKNPDYTAEENLIKKASAIPGGSFTPIGDYLDLQEIDQNVLLNPILANAAANRRAIQNQGLNAGNTMAGLIASNYTDNNAIGNTLIQGIQNNNNIKSQEAQFNRGTNQANSQMGLQALAMDQQKAQLELSTLANAITAMKQTDAARSTAIGAELGFLADDLANIGRETSDNKMLKGLIDSGVLQEFLTGKKKNGGCLNRRKK